MRSTHVAALALAMYAELEAQERPQPSDWNVTLGAAALIIPEYPGADEYRIIPFPMSRVMYGNRLYLGPSTSGFGGAIGAYAIRSQRFAVAAELGLLDSRPADRADALVGTDDRDPVATAGASLSYRAGPVEGLIGGSRGLNDGAGFLGTARLSVTQQLGRLRATAGVNATFADGRQMRREFELTELEAARRRALLDAGDSRLTPDETIAYRPEGGLRHVGASLSLAYLLSRRWSLVGFGGLDRLGDEATASPLVRRREQFSGGLGLGYQL